MDVLTLEAVRNVIPKMLVDMVVTTSATAIVTRF